VLAATAFDALLAIFLALVSAILSIYPYIASDGGVKSLSYIACPFTTL
jgi:hypothetical protein